MQRKTAIVSSIVFASLLFVPKAFAETSVNVSNNGEGSHTDVNVHTSTGNNTVCVNGKCTTTDNGSNGQSTVCINGKCTTSSGNIDMHSDDNNSNVHIDTNNDDTHITPPVHPSITMPTMPPFPTIATSSTDKVLGDKIERQQTEMQKFFSMLQEKINELKKLFHF